VQQRHLHGSERFHLDPGRAHRLGAGGAAHGRGAGQQLKLQRHPGQRHRVAQRDEIAGFFGRHDAGQPRHAQHIAFFRATGFDQPQGGRFEPNQALGHRHAVTGRLGPHIDHMGLTLGVEVG